MTWPALSWVLRNATRSSTVLILKLATRSLGTAFQSFFILKSFGEIQIPVGGDYEFVLRYARGQWSGLGELIGDGQVEVLIDGSVAGQFPLVTHLQWSDWQLSPTVLVPMTTGSHQVTLRNPYSDEINKPLGVATEPANTYVLKSSTNLADWAPVLTIIGDGTIQNATAVDLVQEAPRLFIMLEITTAP